MLYTGTVPAGHDFTNQQVAQLLRKMAAAYEIKSGDFFHIQAYQNAAESIDHLGANIRDLWQQEKLGRVAGLGEKLTAHIDELFRTGKVQRFQTVMKGIPAGTFGLLDLPDIGPKTAFKIATKLDLKTEETALDELRSALAEGGLNDVEGIGPKTIEGLLQALGAKKTRSLGQRLFLPDAEAIAQEVIDYLKQDPSVEAAEALGSLRRRSATVGDIDIGVKSSEPKKVFAHLIHFPGLKKLTSSGANTAMITHNSGRQMDIKVHEPQGWGSMLQHYTGSKAHNIHLRTLAKQKGISLSEYGIKAKDGTTYFTDEKSFYSALGMDYIPPELREDTGEIEAAKKHTLPRLVELKDIRGDLHVHSNLDWPSSHDMNVSSFDELFSAAEKLGYEYLGISDHNPKSGGLSAADRRRFVERRNEQIDRAVEKWTAKTKKSLVILKGLEVDIRPDGTLALEDESLNAVDYVIASVHSAFNQSKDEATKRVLKALQHPEVSIWGHPSGRKLGERRGLEYDWKEIFSFCANEGKIVEINASPWRLDLPDTLVRVALESGVQFCIDTDSHDVEHFSFMKYGVDVARRGWVEKKDVVNVLSIEALQKFLTK